MYCAVLEYLEVGSFSDIGAGLSISSSPSLKSLKLHGQVCYNEDGHRLEIDSLALEYLYLHCYSQWINCRDKESKFYKWGKSWSILLTKEPIKTTCCNSVVKPVEALSFMKSLSLTAHTMKASLYISQSFSNLSFF